MEDASLLLLGRVTRSPALALRSPCFVTRSWVPCFVLLGLPGWHQPGGLVYTPLSSSAVVVFPLPLPWALGCMQLQLLTPQHSPASFPEATGAQPGLTGGVGVGINLRKCNGVLWEEYTPPLLLALV